MPAPVEEGGVLRIGTLNCDEMLCYVIEIGNGGIHRCCTGADKRSY